MYSLLPIDTSATRLLTQKCYFIPCSVNAKFSTTFGLQEGIREKVKTDLRLF